MRAFPILLSSLILTSCDNQQASAPEAAPSSLAAPASMPAEFQPLASAAVKDAIHRALKTGETQRWQDGGHSGYAVPSGATNDKGCRSIRYTVDQRPEVPFESITACEAN